jgi:hypothetical protein
MPISDAEVGQAAQLFWSGRVGGTQAAKHDKPFLQLIASELSALGWPAHVAQSFNDKEAVVAGYFRVAKSWDVVCRDSSGRPRICVEFKSQVDSYGNNENNRYEEALGSGLDIRARHGGDAALGFVLVICDEPQTRAITRPRVEDADSRFLETSHIDRRIVFAERIVEYQLNERSLYDAAAVLLVRRDGSVEHPENEALWLATFPERLVAAAGLRD